MLEHCLVPHLSSSKIKMMKKSEFWGTFERIVDLELLGLLESAKLGRKLQLVLERTMYITTAAPPSSIKHNGAAVVGTVGDSIIISCFARSLVIL